MSSELLNLPMPHFKFLLAPGDDRIISASRLRRTGLAVSNEAEFNVAARMLYRAGADQISAYKIMLGPRGGLDFDNSYRWATVEAGSDWQDLMFAGRQTWADDYLNGHCLYLAMALHEQHGWPMEGIIRRDPDAERLETVHVWVVDPDGQAVDIQGRQSRSSMLAHYAGHGFKHKEDHVQLESLLTEDILGFCVPYEVEDSPWASPHNWDVLAMAEARFLPPMLRNGSQSQLCGSA